MFIAKRVPNFIYVCVLFVRLNFVVSYFNINTRQLTENLLFFLVQMSKSVYKVSSEREFIVDVFQLSAVFFSLFFLYMLLSMLSPWDTGALLSLHHSVFVQNEREKKNRNQSSQVDNVLLFVSVMYSAFLHLLLFHLLESIWWRFCEL